MEPLQECPDPEACLKSLQGALSSAIGLAGKIIDSVSRNIKKFCDDQIDIDKLLDDAATELAKVAKDQLGSVANDGNVKNCVSRYFKGGLTTWKMALISCAGGINGIKNTIKGMMGTVNHSGLINSLCSPDGLSGFGSCVTVLGDSCVNGLAPWTAADCLEPAGFTKGDIFTKSGENTYEIVGDKKVLVAIACDGFTLEYDIDYREGLTCAGTITIKLIAGNLDPALEFGAKLFDLEESFETKNELASIVIAASKSIKDLAKSKIEEAYGLVFRNLKIAYQNKLKLSAGIKGAINPNMDDIYGGIVEALLNSAKGFCGTKLPCIDTAIAAWNSTRGGNTDACQEALKKKLIPLNDDVQPIGWHSICIDSGSSWPSPGSAPGQGQTVELPMPPTPGNPAWDAYVSNHTKQQGGSQCESAVVLSWKFAEHDGKSCIDITYRFQPCYGWAPNAAGFIPECQEGDRQKIWDILRNITSMLNATRGPCGISPLYSLVGIIDPQAGNTQFIAYNPETCQYECPGKGLVGDDDRGGNWPPPGFPGNFGPGGFPLPDDCKYYPYLPSTSNRRNAGFSLVILKKILAKINPTLDWGNTEAENQAIINRIKEAIDKACS
jgi:hypothetical protein